MPALVCAADDPRWLEERRRGVTATDIVIILGLSSHSSPYGLWWEKTAPELVQQSDSDRWRLGRFLESYVIERWDEANIANITGMAEKGLYRSSVRPWQLATPDVIYVTFNSGMGVMEAKTWADADKASWQDGPPPNVRAQVLWQMDVMQITLAHVAVVFLPGGAFAQFTISHDDECCFAGEEEACEEFDGLCEECYVCADIKVMREAGAEFWDRVQTGRPPDADGSAATLAALRARFTPAEGPAAVVETGIWDVLSEHRALARHHERQAKAAEAKIREQIGTAARIKAAGIIVGRRTITQVPEGTRAAYTRDSIRVLKNGDDDE